MNDIHPIKPEIVPDWTGLFIFIAIAALLVWAIYLLVRWRKKNQEVVVEPVEVEPIESVQERALKQLSVLEMLIENKKWEEWYFESTVVVKEYVSVKYGKDLQEMTTEEIGRTVKDEELGEVLKMLDKGKFAEIGLDEETVKQVEAMAREYIQR